VTVKHCGFTDEELDFIINYDPSAPLRAGSQYRMGRNAGDGESEADGER
jgi:hypothetical protein